jgi:limonene 1,2-monooxygenase
VTDTTLRFGVFIPPQHPLGENPTLLFERDLAVVSMCDRLGFDEAWIGEHHSGGWETIAAPEIVIAVAAERTKHIRLGTGVRSLPYAHPFNVADTIVQLDHMTRGRVMFGIGPGALPMDAMQLGIDPTRTREMMEEALEVIIPLLEGKRVSAETDWFTLRDAKLQIEPFSKPRIEMAVTSVRSPAGAMLAGRFGLGMLSLGGASDDALARYGEHARICRELADRHGQTVGSHQFRIAIPVHLAETRDRAIADLAFGFDQWVDYARDVLPFSPVPREVADPLRFVMETRRAIIGTPDDAIRAIEDILAGAGGMGAFLIMEQDWADWSATDRSYEMFARYVVPHFRGQFAARQTSYDVSKAQHASYVVAAQKGVANAQDSYARQRQEPPAPGRKAGE